MKPLNIIALYTVFNPSLAFITESLYLFFLWSPPSAMGPLDGGRGQAGLWLGFHQHQLSGNVFLSILTVAFFLPNIFLCFASSPQPRCALHIHMVLSHWYYYIPSVMSSASAVGIIVAQGNALFEDGSLNKLSKGQEEAMIKSVIT